MRPTRVAILNSPTPIPGSENQISASGSVSLHWWLYPILTMGSESKAGYPNDELHSLCHLQHFVQREKISSDDEGNSLKHLDTDSWEMKDTDWYC